LRYRHFNLAKQRHNLVPPSLFFGMVSLLTKAVSLSSRLVKKLGQVTEARRYSVLRDWPTPAAQSTFDFCHNVLSQLFQPARHDV